MDSTNRSNDSGRLRRSTGPIVAALCVSVTVAYLIDRALARGQDWSFDSHSYHNVYAYASLFESARIGQTPMSLGAYFNPVLDLPLGWAVRNVGPRKIVAAIAAVQAVAIVGAALLPWHALTGSLLPGRRTTHGRHDELRWIATYFGSVVGAYGAIGRIQLGATFGDLTSLVPAVIGVHLLVTWVWHPTARALLGAGSAFGASCALKYTNGPAMLGGLLFVLVLGLLSGRSTRRFRATLRSPTSFLVGTAAGFAVVAGPWSVRLWIRFGNPLFPFGGQRLNPAMSTEDGGYVDLGANSFAMRSAGKIATVPFRLLRSSADITELPVRDPRLAVGVVSCACCYGLAAYTRRRSRDRRPPSASARRTRQIAVAGSTAWCGSYLAWSYLFGNGRYVVFLELLTPTMVVAAVASVWSTKDRFGVAPCRTLNRSAVALGVLALVAGPMTISPELNHVSFADRWYDFDLSGLPPLDDALVVVPYEFEPLDFGAFLLAPKSFVRLHSTLLPTELGQREVARIKAFAGPLYSFQVTDAGDANLAEAGLRAVKPCHPVPAAQGFTFELCPLVRS